MRQTFDRVMVFGARVGRREDGSVTLGHAAQARTDKTVKHYFDRVNSHNPDAFILFSGGHAGYLKDNPGVSEADAMADYAIRGGIPGSIIQKEIGSRSTLGNLLACLDTYGDVLNPDRYSAAEPLTLVSGRYHLARIAFFAEKLGFDPDALHALPSDEYCDVGLEQATLAAYRQAFEEIGNDWQQQAFIEQRALQIRNHLLTDPNQPRNLTKCAMVE